MSDVKTDLENIEDVKDRRLDEKLQITPVTPAEYGVNEEIVEALKATHRQALLEASWRAAFPLLPWD